MDAVGRIITYTFDESTWPKREKRRQPHDPNAPYVVITTTYVYDKEAGAIIRSYSGERTIVPDADGVMNTMTELKAQGRADAPTHETENQ